MPENKPTSQPQSGNVPVEEKAIKVKIVSCEYPEGWYSKLIGETFEVTKRPFSRDYVLWEDYQDKKGFWRHISEQDAVELSPPVSDKAVPVEEKAFFCEWFEEGKQLGHCKDTNVNGTQCIHCYEIKPWPKSETSPPVSDKEGEDEITRDWIEETFLKDAYDWDGGEWIINGNRFDEFLDTIMQRILPLKKELEELRKQKDHHDNMLNDVVKGVDEKAIQELTTAKLRIAELEKELEVKDEQIKNLSEEGLQVTQELVEAKRARDGYFLILQKNGLIYIPPPERI